MSGITALRISLFALVFLTGCAQVATAPSKDPRFRNLIQPVELRLTIPQSALQVDYSPSWKVWTASLAACATTAAVTGICLMPGAVVNLDAAEVKAATKRLAPLNDAAADIHFDHRAADALAGALRAEGMAVARTTMLKNSDERAHEAAFFASSAGSLMYLEAIYRVTGDFSRLAVRAKTQVFARATAARRLIKTAESDETDRLMGTLLATSNAVYWVDFVYEARLPVPGSNADENAALWAANEGRLVRAAILEGVAQLGRVTAHDFGTRLWAGEKELSETQTLEGTKAWLVEQVDDRRRLLRLHDGSLLFEVTLDAAPVDVAQ